MWVNTCRSHRHRQGPWGANQNYAQPSLSTAVVSPMLCACASHGQLAISDAKKISQLSVPVAAKDSRAPMDFPFSDFSSRCTFATGYESAFCFNFRSSTCGNVPLSRCRAFHALTSPCSCDLSDPRPSPLASKKKCAHANYPSSFGSQSLRQRGTGTSRTNNMAFFSMRRERLHGRPKPENSCCSCSFLKRNKKYGRKS